MPLSRPRRTPSPPTTPPPRLPLPQPPSTRLPEGLLTTPANTLAPSQHRALPPTISTLPTLLMSASPPPPPALPRALPPASPLAATAPLWLALVAATACICCVCQRKSPPRAKSGSTSPLQHSAQARGLSTREVAGPHATHAASRSMAATQETKRAPSPHVKSPLLPPHAVPAGGASWSAKSVPVPDEASILLDELSTLRELPSTSPEPASLLQIAHSPTLVSPSTLQTAHLHLPE
eukprot:3921130-Pleurochrysis_carterae.AAC.1